MLCPWLRTETTQMARNEATMFAFPNLTALLRLSKGLREGRTGHEQGKKEYRMVVRATEPSAKPGKVTIS
jgi:hypothetical protein